MLHIYIRCSLHKRHYKHLALVSSTISPRNTLEMLQMSSICMLRSSASFLAQTSFRSPWKLFILIILKNTFSGSKHPKSILFNFENRRTPSHAPYILDVSHCSPHVSWSNVVSSIFSMNSTWKLVGCNKLKSDTWTMITASLSWHRDRKSVV